MRRFLASGKFLFFVWAIVEIGFWVLNAPPNGYTNTQGSLMTPVIMTILWPFILICSVIATRR